MNVVIFPKIHLSSQNNHPGWLSKPVSFRNQSSLTPPTLHPHSSTAQPGLTQIGTLACCPGAGGLLGSGARLNRNPGPCSQPRTPSLPAPHSQHWGREKGRPENCLSLAWPFPRSISTPQALPRVCVFSRVWLFATLWTVARQVRLSLRFSRQEYWSGLPFPPPGALPDPEIEPTSPESPALLADSLLMSH